MEQLVDSIEELLVRMDEYEERYSDYIGRVHADFRRSALNLVHYRALRSVDLRPVQEKLGQLGISRLAQSQAFVKAGLLNGRHIIRSLLGIDHGKPPRTTVSVRKSSKLLRSHTKSLFGSRSPGRRTRIMVTLPSKAALDYTFVHRLVQVGMNSARINCAHDNREVWASMIWNVRESARANRRKVKICMDLSGPKIRTGPMVAGRGVIRFQPDRDSLGHVSGPGLVWLGPEAASEDSDDHAHVPVSAEWLSGLKSGDQILFKDTRDKDRFVQVVECQENGCWAHAFDRSFVVAGTILYHNEWGERPTKVGDVPPVEEVIVLKPGDDLILHRSGDPGAPATHDEFGNLMKPAHISCTNHDVFTQVEPGDRVIFDDGKIEGQVADVEWGDSLRVRVLRAKPQGQKLRSDKGINFPDSNLAIRGLTQKDRDDLRFVVEHADVVNMSFVNTPEDVEDLLAELVHLGALHKIGVILKIETRHAFDNLTELLLTAMRTHPVGVMIARGDLAVECGWRNVPMIQQEIQSFCRAAHVPDVWATQVLENLVKKGLPTRAELTDAASANWAECVMLNKGTYVDRAIAMLDSILRDMRPYVHDKAPMFPPLPEERSKPSQLEERLQQTD